MPTSLSFKQPLSLGRLAFNASAKLEASVLLNAIAKRALPPKLCSLLVQEVHVRVQESYRKTINELRADIWHAQNGLAHFMECHNLQIKLMDKEKLGLFHAGQNQVIANARLVKAQSKLDQFLADFKRKRQEYIDSLKFTQEELDAGYNHVLQDVKNC